MLTFLNLKLDSFLNKTEITARLENKVLIVTRKDAHYKAEHKKTLSEAKTKKFLKSIEEINLRLWKENFKNDYGVVLDGTSWELYYKFEGEKERKIKGTDCCPENWNDFIEAVDIISPLIDKGRVDLISFFFNSKDIEQKLFVSRKEKTLKITENNINGDSFERTYKIKSSADSLINGLAEKSNAFVINENPKSEKDTPQYRLSLTYHSGKKLMLAGPYNCYGLPENFEPFIDCIKTFLFSCDNRNGIFDERLEKQGLLSEQIIFLSVVFSEGGKSYYYKTKDKTLRKGDRVYVPVGADDTVKTAKISNVEYFSENEAPFPKNKVKEVIMKYQNDENVNKNSKMEISKFLCIYIPFLTSVSKSENIINWCREYSPYEECTNKDLATLFARFTEEAYKCGIVIHDYDSVIKNARLDEEKLIEASPELLEKLTKKEVLAVIAYHFRRDYFIEGSLINKSIAEGAMLRLLIRLDELIK